jgi:hypothetical protein
MTDYLDDGFDGALFSGTAQTWGAYKGVYVRLSSSRGTLFRPPSFDFAKPCLMNMSYEYVFPCLDVRVRPGFRQQHITCSESNSNFVSGI